jgi:hypothetical protein
VPRRMKMTKKRGELHHRGQIQGQLLFCWAIQQSQKHPQKHPQEHPQQQVEPFSPLVFSSLVALGLRQIGVLPIFYWLWVIISIFHINTRFLASYGVLLSLD